jgi:hypothetical protein
MNSATVRVRIPVATRVLIDPIGASPNVTLVGGGSYAMVVLAQRGGSGYFVSTNLADCSTVCRSVASLAVARNLSDTASITVISQVPVKHAQLRLPNMTGSTRLVSGSSRPVMLDRVTTVQARVRSVAGAFNSFGATKHVSAGRAVLLTSMTVQQGQLAYDEIGECYSFGTPSLNELTYAPGCPGATSGSSEYQLGPAAHTTQDLSTVATVSASGNWSEGLWNTAAMPASSVSAQLIWL